MSYVPPLPSLKNIAEEVGTSISLVSKVLNNRLGNTRVSEETANRIREASIRLNYRKNSSALSLHSGLHNTIGVMIHHHGEPGTSLVHEMVQGIAELARKEHLKLMLGYFKHQDEFKELCASAHRGFMDGVILGGVPHREMRELAYELHITGLPMITILEKPLHEDILNIGLDTKALCALPTRQLLEAGCTRLGHLHAHEDRYLGFAAAMEEAGVPVDPKLIFTKGGSLFSYKTGVDAANHWLEQETIPDGVVAQSDNQAMGVLNTFKQAGIVCPRDVKISGVDNSPYCQLIHPPLTSVDQLSYERGRLALESFITLRDGSHAESRIVTPELHVRDSSR